MVSTIAAEYAHGAFNGFRATRCFVLLALGTLRALRVNSIQPHGRRERRAPETLSLIGRRLTLSWNWDNSQFL